MSGSDTSLQDLSPVKRAIVELRALRSRLDEAEYRAREPIAIIGAGLRFPGAVDCRSYWDLLEGGIDAVGEVPAGRWDIDAYYDPEPGKPGKMVSRQGGFLRHVDRFDPQPFGISPREAISMDPQQRLVLEVGWEALESAGRSLAALDGSATGVFVGIGNSDYWRALLADPLTIDTYTTTGNSFSIAASRLAYLFGFRGPSIALDTACSSSLVAVHLAMSSLRSRECDLALAGGVSLILSPEVSINLSLTNMLAPDGRCKTLDASADGYGRGEGCGVVVLERLSDAVANSDPIIAVIRGSAINQDGRSAGITAPNGPAQESVIRQALKNAGVEPADIGYLELHGTGTPLGDPIEAQALGGVFNRASTGQPPLTIGSVKTNIGHLEFAAGMAGLIKAALAVRDGRIPPHLNLEQVNPLIALDELGLRVNTEPIAWPDGHARRIAGVSSFGISGTNAHLIVEQPPASEQSPPGEAGWTILTLSGARESVLGELAARYQAHLAEGGSFRDTCFTANVGRSHHAHRLAVVVDSAAGARAKLGEVVEGGHVSGVFQGHVEPGVVPEVAFLFTGQGDPYPGMGAELYEREPVFRETLDRCAERLSAHLDRPLVSVLYPADPARSLLHRTGYAQPALFALQVSMAELWRSWGIEPAAVIGHSVGEFAAAYVAGVFGLEDGLDLIAARGRLMEALPEGGAMAAVFAGPEVAAEALAAVAGRVEIAAYNGPTNTVVSGERGPLDAVLERLSAAGVGHTGLEVSHAFHSHLLEPALDALEREADKVAFAAPRVSLISNLTGRLAGLEDIGSGKYWRRHAREPVQFARGIETLAGLDCGALVEVGPHTSMLGMAARFWPGRDVARLPSLRRGRDAQQQMLESLAGLHVTGADVDWEAFQRPRGGRRTAIPTYPWQRRRFWARAMESHNRGAPDDERLWEAVTDAGRRQAAQGPLDLDLASYDTKWGWLDRLSTAYITRAMRGWGLFTRAGEAHSLDDIMTESAVLPLYRKQVRGWLEAFVRAGLLARVEGGGYVSPEPLPAVEPDALVEQARGDFTEAAPFLQWAINGGEALDRVLTGQMNALETLFPDGSVELSEFLYREWSGARYFSAIMRSLVGTFAANRGAARPLRALEIGAGTGGTTVAVLPVLPRECVYLFTDISEFFVERARRQLAAFPMLRFGVLDIEKEPTDQGYPPGGFDLVIATNVLHATPDLAATLQRARSLVAPGGLLLVSESTREPFWLTTTIGLIEGWQVYDDALRSDNPLLTDQGWIEALRECGFENVAVFPDSGGPADVLFNQVFAAHVAAAEGVGARDAAADDEQWDAFELGAAPAAPESAGPSELLRRLGEAPDEERRRLLEEVVTDQVAGVLRLDAGDRPHRRSGLMDVGLDSLMAIELRDRLRIELEIESTLPATLALDYPTIEAVADYLGRRFFGLDEPAATPLEGRAQSDAGPVLAPEALQDLSDDEVEALLLEKLARREEGRPLD